MEDVACRVESASPSELDRIQKYLAEGIIGALSSSGDSAMLEAAGSHVVKVRIHKRAGGVLRRVTLRDVGEELKGSTPARLSFRSPALVRYPLCPFLSIIGVQL